MLVRINYRERVELQIALRKHINNLEGSVTRATTDAARAAFEEALKNSKSALIALQNSREE